MFALGAACLESLASYPTASRSARGGVTKEAIAEVSRTSTAGVNSSDFCTPQRNESLRTIAGVMSGGMKGGRRIPTPMPPPKENVQYPNRSAPRLVGSDASYKLNHHEMEALNA